jgi:hypothetical protein
VSVELVGAEEEAMRASNLAATDAERDDAASETVTTHRVNEFCREHRASGANRMTVGDCTAFDIDDIVGQSKLAGDDNGNRAKASLISIRSIARISQPARCSASLTAGTGPNPNMPGLTAAMP